MNQTLYRMLTSTEIIKKNLPKIIEAFVLYYGEEERKNIQTKFNNMIIMGYGNLKII